MSLDMTVYATVPFVYTWLSSCTLINGSNFYSVYTSVCFFQFISPSVSLITCHVTGMFYILVSH